MPLFDAGAGVATACALVPSCERSGLMPSPAAITERSHRWVKGLTRGAPMRRICRRPPGPARPNREGVRQPWRKSRRPRQARDPHWSTAGRDTARPARLRQSGRSTTPRPCSTRRRRTSSPIARRYQYGRRGTPTSEALERALAEIEGGNAPASRCCRRGWRRSRPRCCRSPAAATTSWSPTASTGRRAISATACSSAWASARPTTIR